MATHTVTHGAVGTTLDIDCTSRAGTAPDLSAATIQVEVFRKGNASSVVLDTSATGNSSGRITLTWTADHFTTIPNRTEEYGLICWATQGQVTQPYPEGGYDTLEVTADPQGVPDDVESVSYLSTAEAAATYVTLATAQTITGQKTIRIDGNNDFLKFSAEADKHTLVIYRYANPAGPEWDTGTIINSQGAYLSNAWMVLSGNMEASPDQEGIYLPDNPTSDPFMLAIWSDIVGPAIVARANPTGSPGYLFQGMDGSGNYVFSVEDDGELQWGAGATHAAHDTYLYRSGSAALRTNASLRVDGGSGGGGLIFTDDTAASFITRAGGSAQPLRFSGWSLIDLGTVTLYQTASGGGYYIISLDNATLFTNEGGSTGTIFMNSSDKLGFFGVAPIAKPTGVAVTAAGIHAALVSLGLIAA